MCNLHPHIAKIVPIFVSSPSTVRWLEHGGALVHWNVFSSSCRSDAVGAPRQRSVSESEVVDQLQRSVAALARQLSAPEEEKASIATQNRELQG